MRLPFQIDPNVLQLMEIDPAIRAEAEKDVSRATFAMALAASLFAKLVVDVPAAASYVADCRAAGRRVTFDHGAIRTVLFPDGGTGALPAGELAFRRILEPLGYELRGVYPLPRLNMTGRAYCHRDLPETVPQYFVSELHVDRFGPDFGATAKRVFGTSRDPLGAAALSLLGRMEAEGRAPMELAEQALPEIAAAFGRHHDLPTAEDYSALLGQSAEAAWIATEGNTFNHATDRVIDVEELAEEQRRLERPIKEKVEVSTSGRVRQTAFRAAPVSRALRDGTTTIDRMVPGSFYEFISRSVDPENGRLDLSFDSGNATGIFQMTRSA